MLGNYLGAGPGAHTGQRKFANEKVVRGRSSQSSHYYKVEVLSQDSKSQHVT